MQVVSIVYFNGVELTIMFDERGVDLASRFSSKESSRVDSRQTGSWQFSGPSVLRLWNDPAEWVAALTRRGHDDLS